MGHTKEEILEKSYPDLIEYPHYGMDRFQESVALDAMDEYAKQQSISFQEWTRKEGFEYQMKQYVRWEQTEKSGKLYVSRTPEQLYELFLKSKSQ